MKTKYTYLIALLVVAMATTQCKKKSTTTTEEEPAPAAPSGTSSIGDVFTNNGAQAQTFQVSGTVAQTLTVNGVLIEIPANAFLTGVGGAVTGTVGVTVKTILTKSEIILSGAGANSTGSRLVATKGCVKVTASQNSQSLRLNTSSNFIVDISSPTNTTTASTKKLYAPKVTASDSTKFWSIENDTTSIPVSFDGMKYHHRAKLDSLKWLNVGSQWDSIATKTAAIVTVGSQFNNANTVVYISFNNSLTVGALFEIAPGTFRISNMPIGKGVSFVAIAVINGQFYSDVQTTTVKPTATPLNLTAKTFAQVQSQLALLP